MKGLMTFLAVLGWLLIVYWGLPSTPVPGNSEIACQSCHEPIGLPPAPVPGTSPGTSIEEPQGGQIAPGFDTGRLPTETIDGLSRTLLETSVGNPTRRIR